MIKTVTLTGTEEKVAFAGTHTIYWVQNLGGGDILAGLEPELADGKDDVLIVPSGGTGYVRLDAGTKTVYLSGTGKVQVYGTNNAFCPFKSAPKGGDEIVSDGGNITVGAVDYPLVGFNLYGKSVQDTSTGGEPAGKNLFDINGNVNVWGLNGSQVDKNFVEGNVLTTNTDAYLAHSAGQKIKVGVGTTVTISAKVISFGAGSAGIFTIYETDTTLASWYTSHICPELNKTYALTYTAQCDELIFGFASNGGTGAQFTDIQVEIGSTATTYEPYKGKPTPEYPIPIENIGDDGAVEVTACGKNLLNITLPRGTWTTNGITYTINEDSSITFSGTATANLYLDVATLNLAKGTYVLSGCPIGGDGSTYQLYSPELQAYDRGDGAICKVEENTSVKIRFVVYSGATVNFTVYPQIEFGSTVTEYEPYTGNTATITTGLPLCSVGEYRDELIYNADGTGKIIKRVGIVDMGTLSWNYNTAEKRLWAELTAQKANGGAVMCAIYPESKSVDEFKTRDKQILSYFSDNWKAVNVRDSSYTDANSFKTAMSGVMLYCELATPQEITLSATEIAELQKLQTFDGMTNIYNDEGTEMSVKVATNPLLSEYVMPIIEGITARYEARIAALEAAVTNT